MIRWRSSRVAAWAMMAGGLAAIALGDAVEPSPPLAVHGEVIHTMAGPPIRDGVVLVVGGTVQAVGPATSVVVPANARRVHGRVVTPGLIDAHTVVGLAGIHNQPHDQDQLDAGDPLQPELRATDAYNSREPLVAWLRGFGITTIHTGHAPAALVSGQTMVVKTVDDPSDHAVLEPVAMVAGALGEAARPRGAGADSRSPGTRSKAVAMLRGELVRAQDYARRRSTPKPPERDLRKESLAAVLDGTLPLLITVNRTTDILAALRIAEEFQIRVVLDSVAEGYLVADRIAAAGVPVIVHPTMKRAGRGETENVSFETAAVLRAAGIPIALQSGYEDYVPRTRVVLFEAAVAAANGLGFEAALAAVTVDAARILGVADRIGTLEPGRDGDLAVFDGDPFEYTTHCTAVVIDGRVLREEPR